MKLRFREGFNALQAMVMFAGIAGEWQLGENHYQYRANDGAVLNWWKSTGTITFQGPELVAIAFKATFSKALAEAESTGMTNPRVA